MKKLLGSTLALALFLPAAANAELLKNLKVGGQLDVQTTSARNVTDYVTRPQSAAQGDPANNDRIGSAFARVMLKMDWDLLDDVHARVNMVKGASNNASRAYGTVSQDLNTIQTVTFVEEAFVKIDKLFGFADMTMGRQFYGEPGDLIVYYGPRDNYGMTVSALDAFRFDWNGEHMSVTGVAGKVSGGALTTTPSDVDLRGLVVSCNKHENVKGSAYLYNRVTHAAGGLGRTAGTVGYAGVGGKNDQLWVAGIKSKMTFGGLMAAVELAKNFGQDRTTYLLPLAGTQAHNVNYGGYAIKLNVGYKAEVQDMGAVNPWLEFAKGTGDNNFDHAGNRNFQSISTDYRPGGIYGRFDAGAAVALGSNSFGEASNGLSNRVIYGLGVKATPASLNKLTAGLQFYRYAFDRLPPNANGLRFSRNIGSEVDVTGEWKHSENVSAKLTLGSFKPGAYIADTKNAFANAAGTNVGLNPVVMAAADFSIKF